MKRKESGGRKRETIYMVVSYRPETYILPDRNGNMVDGAIGN